MEPNNNQPEYLGGAQTLLEAPKEKMPLWALLCLFALLILISLGLIAFFQKEPTEEILPEQNIAEEKASPYDGIELEATAVIVWDVANQKVLFEKNSSTPLPLASLTKVMATLVASDLIPGYTTVTIEKDFLNEEGDTGLYANEKWHFNDLARFSLTVSSNDGMRAIASVAGAVLSNTTGIGEFETGRSAFVERMNQKAQKIGLTKTSFENETGLDLDEENGGAYGTAYDMAHLFEYALGSYPEILEGTRAGSYDISSLSNLSHSATNTNPYVNFIPGIIGSKTGYTDLSGGNLVIAFNPELQRPIIISVLGSSYDGRFVDTLKLVEATMALVEQGN
ncbi:MAG: hypothetical protein RJA61_120 [Candidatus Parcubacteria bacterium]|jgi:D-alanyl-D-alanine carboxypeptidase